MSDPQNAKEFFQLRDTMISRLLDEIEVFSEQRPKDKLGPKEYQARFLHAMPREQAAEVMTAVLHVFEARQGSTAAAYAYMGLYRALGIDFDASQIVFLKDG